MLQVHCLSFDVHLLSRSPALTTLAPTSDFPELPISLWGSEEGVITHSLSLAVFPPRMHGICLQSEELLSSGNSLPLCHTACPAQGSWYVCIPLKSWRAELCVMLVALWVRYMVKQPPEPKKNTWGPSAVGVS